jgi:NADPH-dependent 2,4-dienoyl-CoA reductase/sulfur reductase-like enzyme
MVENMVTTMKTADGFQYFPDSGKLVTGLPTKAVVSPPARNNKTDKVYDAVIVGAGYTGLIAARELALRGTERDRSILVENGTLTYPPPQAIRS